ncbi:prominin-like protein isoform X1 [Drosophila busckii]|uniref:prominin-like protein isoform X1 n=2 Tax=Drosophila busckii TaxID=30019 RepID=UPI001432FCA4|nr:prominin-like protein isoform X1 [Drosophila busckii]
MVDVNKNMHHCSKIIFIFFSWCFILLSCFITPVALHDVEWKPGYEGHGTVHEQAGQVHWPEVEYSDYDSKPQYSKPEKEDDLATRGLSKSLNKVAAFLFDNTLIDPLPVPKGYLTYTDDKSVEMGPKYEENEWAELVTKYWLLYFWLVLLLLIIIIVPFIAVCYFCFCCCRRVNAGCAPCDMARDRFRCFVCAALLLLLLIPCLFGAIIAVMAERLVERGFSESTVILQRSTNDTCTFLNDTSEHIRYLFEKNYEELFNHLTDLLTNSDKHINLDLADSSGSTALEVMERILDNMPKAQRLMKEVKVYEEDLRFTTAQFRDGMRGIRRDVTFACTMLSNHYACRRFLVTSDIETMDMSKCMHLDQMPVSQKYLDGMKDIIEGKFSQLPRNAMERQKTIYNKIAKATERVSPALIRDLHRGRDEFIHQENIIRNILKTAVHDIYKNTDVATRSFDDIYYRYGKDRSIMNKTIISVLILIIALLLLALLLGLCFAWSISTGLLLLAILVIFCFLSLFTLVGLFYFILGLITYQGACAPVRSDPEATFVKQMNGLDPEIDITRYLPPREREEAIKDRSKLRISHAIRDCKEGQTIFELLKKYKLYIIEDIRDLKILSDDREDKQPKYHDDDFNEDLSNTVLLPHNDTIRLNDMRNANLSSYHSLLYLENMCWPVGPDYYSMAKSMKSVGDNMWTAWGGYWDARSSLYSNARHIMSFYNAYHSQIKNNMNNIKKRVAEIDELILYNNNDFSNSMLHLLDAVKRAEKFIQERGKDFINSLITNLTDAIHEQVDLFAERIIVHCLTHVGKCEPLSYLHKRAADRICDNLIYPFNQFWLGLLPCCLLLIPILFIAHRLLGLYQRLAVYSRATGIAIVEHGCPICTGAPYMPPPIVVCGGGQRIVGGFAQPTVVLPDQPLGESYVKIDEDLAISISKRKRD